MFIYSMSLSLRLFQRLRFTVHLELLYTHLYILNKDITTGDTIFINKWAIFIMLNVLPLDCGNHKFRILFLWGYKINSFYHRTSNMEEIETSRCEKQLQETEQVIQLLLQINCVCHFFNFHTLFHS